MCICGSIFFFVICYDTCKHVLLVADLIEKLNSKGKYLDAVKFANAFDLMGKFPPVPLLKEYLKASKDAAQDVRKKGNNSAQARVCTLNFSFCTSIFGCACSTFKEAP